jgi:hypothetical protein
MSQAEHDDLYVGQLGHQRVWRAPRHSILPRLVLVERPSGDGACRRDRPGGLDGLQGLDGADEGAAWRYDAVGEVQRLNRVVLCENPVSRRSRPAFGGIFPLLVNS